MCCLALWRCLEPDAASTPINNQKSHRLVTQGALTRAGDFIVHWWDGAFLSNGDDASRRFFMEAAQTLPLLIERSGTANILDAMKVHRIASQPSLSQAMVVCLGKKAGQHFERRSRRCNPLYVAYPPSYRHLEEMMQERGVLVDHSSINRWAIRFLPLIEKMARKHKRPVGGSWRMDETYIRVKGV